tara:strand:+ start:1887 stop:2111 length:225 start_codon:yes stop_codon:yes gene_type:complete
MEYVAGPVIALLLGMKFTAFKTSAQDAAIKSLEEKLEQVDARHSEVAQQMPKQMLATVAPMAMAVKKLNQQVGI